MKKSLKLFLDKYSICVTYIYGGLQMIRKGIFLLMSVCVMTFSVYPGDGCYLCGSGSSGDIKQCKYHGSDTFDQRKKCEANGCKVSGTASCSSAANVKVIDPN